MGYLRRIIKFKNIGNLFLMTALFFVFGTYIINAESIKNYNVEILVNKNGTLTVSEKIDYEFDSDYKHGIYRDIPLRSQKDGIDVYKSYVKMHSIKRNGSPEEYTVKNFYEGIRYRVGSENRYVSEGINTYEFNYTIYNAVFEKEGIYQIYYNAIGQFWKVPIEKAYITLKYADNQPIESSEIEKLEVYTGEFGEKGSDYQTEDRNGVIGISTGNLAPYNGLSFLINLNTDKINPSVLDKMKVLYYAEPLIFIAPLMIIILLIYSFTTWIMFGKDPAKKAVIPEFNIPKNISPMYAAYIKGTREPKELLTVGMFSLLSKDYVKAEDEAGEGRDVRYTLSADGERNIEELPIEEKEVFKALSDDKNNIFKDGDKLYKAANSVLNLLEGKYSGKVYKSNSGFMFPFIIAVIITLYFGLKNLENISSLSDLIIPGIFIVIVSSISPLVSGIFKEVSRKGKTFVWITLSIVLLVISSILGMSTFITMLAITVLASIYSMVIGKYTNDGIRQKEYLDGMKMYIKTAEENQIKKFNDVDELVAYFKSILPYAVALGVKNEAIKLMQRTMRLYNFDENTYNSINRRIYFNSYNNFILSNSLSREYNRAYDRIISEKFSSSGGFGKGGFGGGGFSGGGFSGGGSGGGGGGSW